VLPQARIVGGAVRDFLAGHKVADVDFAVPLAPEVVMARLRAAPPRRLAGDEVTVDDLSLRTGPSHTDAVIYSGPSVRVAVRPSGTEPKLKAYLEIHLPARDDVAAARVLATTLLAELRADVVALLQRGPN